MRSSVRSDPFLVLQSCNPLNPCSDAKTVKKKKEKKKKKKWANDGTKEDLFVAIVVLCETILLCVYV